MSMLWHDSASKIDVTYQANRSFMASVRARVEGTVDIRTVF